MTHAWPRAEAVRAGWDSVAAPETGWTSVSLPDSWAQRWPGFDGVVWYRIRWQADDARPIGLMMTYLNMAGSVYLNGTVISQDPRQVEPLTRAWNIPRYWLLASPLLRPGQNELLIRVAGMAAYQPGLGHITSGAPDAVAALYDRELTMRRTLPIVGLAATAILGIFFFAVWLLRREEVAYGWFSLMTSAWMLFGLNHVVTSPWPFSTNDGWQSFNSLCFLLFALSFFVFFMRACERRLPRTERGLGVLFVLACVASVFMPIPVAAAWRAVLLLSGTLLVWLTAPVFAFASRRRRTPYRGLMLFFLLVVVVAGAHDLLVYFELTDSKIYVTFLMSYLLLINMALTLAWRFVSNLRRIEGFNRELEHNVRTARDELAQHLRQQHQLELRNAKLDERLELVRDLHDGLGGTLVGNIAVLERSPAQASTGRALEVLHSLRDDLRLIIDSAAGDDYRDQTMAQLVAPLRHRLGTLLEQNGIACRWQLEGLEQMQPGATRGLDILRILQEALTNVLKHSGADQVDIVMRYADGRLAASVTDNGHGWREHCAGGRGMASMQARARRLGAVLEVSPEQHRIAFAFDAGAHGA
ncbi:7TM diverse intracellular signaling domain-containing protein [Herbaspirillum sp. alder98]|uniref:sensor histidine kinase n=1 Tax=Herbaspirillum sp. alder98 TaxID=2913096 RepID=UPI001CD88ABE|nr:7TM diverse intracellular signaling domain-containing protein [Herbaspirillum sp. alder98]MCA1326742.1 histidine kinase [Herbaspirillum sp. alder98]